MINSNARGAGDGLIAIQLRERIKYHDGTDAINSQLRMSVPRCGAHTVARSICAQHLRGGALADRFADDGEGKLERRGPHDFRPVGVECLELQAPEGVPNGERSTPILPGCLSCNLQNPCDRGF